MNGDPRLHLMDQLLRLMRETLEGVIEPSRVSDALFDALEQQEGELPADLEQVDAFVEGPLRGALEQRVGAEITQDALGRLTALLSAVPQSPPERGAGAAGRSRAMRRRSELDTLRIDLEEGPLRTLVIAGGSSLAVCLRASLGGECISAKASGSVDQMIEDLEYMAPTIVVVDGGDFPRKSAPDGIAMALAAAPAPIACVVVWGTDALEPRALVEALDKRGIGVTTFDRTEGPEPLLDLFRSRARPRGSPS